MRLSVDTYLNNLRCCFIILSFCLMAYGKLISALWSRPRSHYGFVNEHAIRVWAGIMFTIGLITFLSVYYAGMYWMAFVVVWMFWLDFVLKVINPRYSYINAIADYLVRHKEPLRVWAIQKRFARSIGLGLSSFVLVNLINHLFVMTWDVCMMNAHTIGGLSAPMVACLICLVFMRLESILWRCAGCEIFHYLVRNNILKNKDHQNCPDDQCSI